MYTFSKPPTTCGIVRYRAYPYAHREQGPHRVDHISLLLVQDDQRPWSTEELIREVGRELGVRDAISDLYAVGLIHRTTDGFVFATRAATHLGRLDL